MAAESSVEAIPRIVVRMQWWTEGVGAEEEQDRAGARSQFNALVPAIACVGRTHNQRATSETNDAIKHAIDGLFTALGGVC